MGVVCRQVGAILVVVHGAAGGGEETQRGVARTDHRQARRAGVHGDLGTRFAEYLLRHVASHLAPGLHDQRLPQRPPQALPPAVLYVLRADPYPGAVGVGAECAVAQEQGHDAHGV